MKQAETIPLPVRSLPKLENLIGSMVGEIKKTNTIDLVSLNKMICACIFKTCVDSLSTG